MLSPSDTAIVFLLALLLFGPEQLPRIARQLGEAMRHMQATTHAFMSEMDRAARSSDEAPPRVERAQLEKTDGAASGAEEHTSDPAT